MNPKQIEEFFHLTPVQKYLLAASERASDGSSWLTQFGCVLNGQIDVAAFKRAWQKVSDRQFGLRTTFVSGDLKEPVQVINRNVLVDFEEQDWRGVPETEQGPRFSEFLQSDRQEKFLLKNPQLWRLTLLRMSENRYYLIWTYHYLLLDRTSLTIILSEVLAYYEAIHQAQNLILPHPPSARKFVDWLKKQNSGQAEEFWQKQLQGFIPEASLPLEKGEILLSLPDETFASLEDLAEKTQLTLETIFYGAWALLLSRHSGQQDVAFGIRVPSRPKELAGADRLIGQFANTLPLRVQINPQATVSEWLTQIQRQRDEVRSYEYSSLAQIQKWSGLEPETILIASEIVVAEPKVELEINRPTASLELCDLQLPQLSQIMTTVRISQQSGQPIIAPTSSAIKLLGIIESFLTAPHQKLADLLQLNEEPLSASTPPPSPTFTQEKPEDEQGWVNWINSERSVNELFEEQVQQTPDEVAVTFNGKTLTWRELDVRASQLARYLRRLGIAPQAPVGLYLEPSIEMMIGVMGILKAGGAYLPLNPADPLAILQHAIEEVAPYVLLTQQRLATIIWQKVSHKAEDNGAGHPALFRLPIILCLDSDWDEIALEKAESFAGNVSNEHPACLLYSAPSGVEKAPVIISQASLAKTLTTTENWFQFSEHNPWRIPLARFPQSVPDAIIDPAPEAEVATEFDLSLFSLTPELPPEPEIEQEFSLTPELPPAPAPEAEAEAKSESLLLAPMQQWFFAQHPLEPQHWNISLLVEIKEKWERQPLEQALKYLQEHHNNLRVRFRSTEQGWEPKEAAVPDEIALEYLDLSAKWAKSQRRTIEETAAHAQMNLNLAAGPLWRVIYFDLGAAPTDRLLVIFHHLLGDEPSLRIFLADLLTVYQQITKGETPSLPAPTTPWQEWVKQLSRLSQQPEIKDELDYWWETNQASALPVDAPEQKNTYGSIDRVFVSLNKQETQTLLNHVPLVAEAGLNEIILTALVMAVARWSGESSVLIELERSGRANPLVNLDVSRTIGWFTTKIPAFFKIRQVTEAHEALRILQSQLQSIPNQGIGFGLLRYGADKKARTELGELSAPKVSFKYLENLAGETWWQPAKESVGIEQAPLNERSVAISVTGAMNYEALEFQLNYARGQFEQKNISLLVNSFIEELQRLIAHFA